MATCKDCGLTSSLDEVWQADCEVNICKKTLDALTAERDCYKVALEKILERGLNYCTQSTLDIAKEALDGKA